MLGYHHYPDDVVRMFVKKSIENGIDIIRIFDALNDVRNIEVAVDETLKNGAIASGAICILKAQYTILNHTSSLPSRWKNSVARLYALKIWQAF